MHYRVLCFNKLSTVNSLKKTYRKLALQSHPNKNKHPQDSAAFRMINKAKQGLEDLLCHNYSMRRTQEREEDIQRQEETWGEDRRIRNSQ